MIAAVKRGSVFDHTVMTGALAGYSMPIFWWGLLLIIFFSGILGWTPVSGRISLLYYFEPVTGFMLIDSLLSGQEGAFRSALSHLILPAIVLGTIPLAVIARQTRSAMLEVLSEDYVRTARAKGLVPSPGNRPACPAQCDDSGHHRYRAAGRRVVCRCNPDRNYFFLAGYRQMDGRLNFQTRLFIGAGRSAAHSMIVMIVNLMVDLLYGLINPRIRHTE